MVTDLAVDKSLAGNGMVEKNAEVLILAALQSVMQWRSTAWWRNWSAWNMRMELKDQERVVSIFQCYRPSEHMQCTAC